jgi:hypothetical protein
MSHNNSSSSDPLYSAIRTKLFAFGFTFSNEEQCRELLGLGNSLEINAKYLLYQVNAVSWTKSSHHVLYWYRTCTDTRYTSQFALSFS